MSTLKKLRSISDHHISDKRILLRVDFNVIDIVDNTIKHIKKIEDSIPTINMLLKNNNRLILISHSSDSKKSLKPILPILQKLLMDIPVSFIDDFTQQEALDKINAQQPNEVILLENIRFYPGEEKNDRDFAEKLSKLGDVFINDAFGVSHRKHASSWGLTQFLPSYAGLLLVKEVRTILSAIDNPQRPLIVIIGGTKISTKIKFITTLLGKADRVLLGGALANTLLAAQKIDIGKSLYEVDQIPIAESVLNSQYKDKLCLPSDALIDLPYSNVGIHSILKEASIFDIGKETVHRYSDIISSSKTIIWNGPLGKFEDKRFEHGTRGVFDAIVENNTATSIVGGGDTIPAIEDLPGKEHITHISTGGGAMLELIEDETLPCLEPLYEA